MSARQDILDRVREAPPDAAAYADIDRSYLQQPTRSMDDIVELLIDRLTRLQGARPAVQSRRRPHPSRA